MKIKFRDYEFEVNKMIYNDYRYDLIGAKIMKCKCIDELFLKRYLPDEYNKTIKSVYYHYYRKKDYEMLEKKLTYLLAINSYYNDFSEIINDDNFVLELNYKPGEK